MKRIALKIFKNEKVQIALMAFGTFMMVLFIFAGLLYSFDKTTEDPILEEQAEEVAKLAKIRAAAIEAELKKNECE